METPRTGLRMIAPTRAIFGLVWAIGFLALYPGPSQSGDEVDYSAPYLVVEEGKLVTRYPAKPHAPASATLRETAPVAATRGAATPESTNDTGKAWRLMPAVLIAAVAAACGLLVARSRR